MPVIINGTTGVTFPNGVTMSDGTSAPVTVAQGGTGSTTAANARTALGTNDAANITAGTLAVARGGTGTATPSLVGGTNISISGTWPNQTVTGTTGAPTTAQVLSATTGYTSGVVGSFCVPSYARDTAIGVNGTTAGSNLRGTNSEGGAFYPFSGTWRNLGTSDLNTVGYSVGQTLFVRIS